MEDFGRRLRDLRTGSGLSQEAVAKHLGVSAQSVSKWENGRAIPDVTFLVPLARLFSVSTDELLGNETQGQKWDDEWHRAILAGDPGQAAKTALEALEFFPGQPHFLWRLAEAEYMASRFKEGEERRRFLLNAEMHLQAILRQFPDFEEAVRRRAIVLKELGRHQEAEALVRRLPDPDEALLQVLQDKDAWKKQRRRVLAKRAQAFWDMLHNLDMDLAEKFLVEYPWDERDRIDRLSAICVIRAEKLCIAGKPEEALETLQELWELSRRMKEAKAHPERAEALFPRLGDDSGPFPDTMIFGFHVLHTPVFKPLEGRKEFQALLRLANRQLRTNGNEEKEAK